MGNAVPFKSCPFCSRVWKTRDEFLSDPHVRLEGYQVNFGDLVAGVFIFTHATRECGTSLGLEVENFVDLYDGPVFQDRLENTEQCSGMCQHSGILDPCHSKCECAFVREILQIVRNWGKRAA